MHNPKPMDGMAASLACGIRAVLADRPDDLAGVLICPADLPFLGAQDISAVRRAFETGGGPCTAVRATFRGQPGHPVLIGAGLLPAAASLRAGQRPTDFLKGAEMILCARPDDGCISDIDTPRAYSAALERFRASA